MTQQITEKTKEQLEVEVSYWKMEYEAIRRQNQGLCETSTQLSNELSAEHQKGPKLTIKQQVMLGLVMNTNRAFPHTFSAVDRWDKAEKLYAEGAKRGHLPK